MSGEFQTIGFPDIVSILEMGRRSGILGIVNARSTAQIFFFDGRIVHAICGNLVGEDAFYRFVGEQEGHFEFAPGACELAPEAWTIHAPTTALLIEAARVDDERKHSNGKAPSSSVHSVPTTRPPAPLRATTMPPRLAPALEPDTMLAAQLELGLRDPFSLGEPRLWSEGELAKWTRAEGGSSRLHVHLVADRAAGVSALLGLSGSPSERWVLGSLAPEKKAFGLTFFLRHERTIDVVLVDAEDPCAFQASFERSPSVVIVAPPEGDFMSLGIAARVALERLVQKLRPPAIVGVGNASLDGALRAIGITDGRMVRCTEGFLGEANCDLRSVLIKGVRLWAAAGRSPCI
jgi:hypothetical protein